MFNVFGWRLHKIKTVPNAALQCEHCAQSGGVAFDVYQEYAHYFWIPTYPQGKRVVLQCVKCGSSQHQDELSPASLEAAVAARRSARTPAWTFVGLVVLVAAGLYLNHDKIAAWLHGTPAS